MTDVGLVVGDVVVLLATGAMTAAVVGLVRLPDTHVKIHAASQAALLALLVTLGAAFISGDPKMISRAALVAAFLLLTTPASAHALGRLAWSRGRDPDDPG